MVDSGQWREFLRTGALAHAGGGAPDGGGSGEVGGARGKDRCPGRQFAPTRRLLYMADDKPWQFRSLA
jgi:hypothetical protein